MGTRLVLDRLVVVVPQVIDPKPQSGNPDQALHGLCIEFAVGPAREKRGVFCELGMGRRVAVHVVADALLRPTTPKGPQPSMETTPWIASRGVSIEPRRHWYALYRSTRSRGPRDKAGSSQDRAVPDSARASVGRYELLRTTEGQGCHPGLLQSLSGSIGTECDTIPSSVLPGTNSHWWRQGSSLHSIVKRRIQLRSFGSFARRLGALLTTLSATKAIVRGSETYTSKQGGRCGTLQTTLGSSALFRCGARRMYPRLGS